MPQILLVEDDDLLRGTLHAMLKRMGHDVIVARHGKEAWQLCATEPPEIVLTDVLMPEQEGLETIRVFRRAHPDVKIIAMSGGGRGSARDYLEVARKLGAAATLSKPFTFDELRAAIAAVASAE